MTAGDIDYKIAIAKRKLKTVEGKIRRLDRKKACMLERAYLESRHYLEQERSELIEYINW